MLRPKLVIDPAGLVTKRNGTGSAPSLWARYCPTAKRQRTNLVIGIGWSVYIIFCFLVLDAARLGFFFFVLFLPMVADLLRWMLRLGRFQIYRIPRQPILYFPFTTIWMFATACPFAIHQFVGATWWWAYLGMMSGLSLLLFARRIDRHSIEYFLKNPKVTLESRERFKKARKNGKAFRLTTGRYKMKATNAHLPGFEPGTFDRLVNRWLKFRFRRRFGIYLLICCLFVGGIFHFQAISRFDLQEQWARYFWLGCSACLIAFYGVPSLIVPSRRHRCRLTSFAMQLFANSPRPIKDRHIAASAAQSSLGHCDDRRSFLLWSFALFSLLTLQLLVCGPVCMESPIVTEPQDYPLFGSKAFTAFMFPQAGWPIKSVFGVAACSFMIPPLAFFFGLVALIGTHLADGHRLFEADNALEHIRIPFNLDGDETSGTEIVQP